MDATEIRYNTGAKGHMRIIANPETNSEPITKNSITTCRTTRRSKVSVDGFKNRNYPKKALISTAATNEEIPPMREAVLVRGLKTSST